MLSVSGSKRESTSEEGVTFLHQGIAQRAFKLSFRLDDHIEIKGANLSNGLLSIDLQRVVPEEAKPNASRSMGIRSLLCKTDLSMCQARTPSR